MKIRYESVTGEVSEIEVNDTIGEATLELERQEHNTNRRETRRHESYSDQNDKWDTLIDTSVDIEGDFMRKAEQEKLYEAIRQLLPQQQRLITYRFKIGKSETEIAADLGISQQAVSKQLKGLYKNLKKFLE